LENPAVDLIKSIPSVWDETVVLPVSEIGEVAAFARRNGNTSFLAVLNGSAAKSVDIPLSFLKVGEHKAMLVRDKMDDPAAVIIENSSFRNRDSVKIDMRPGGGFIARFI
jgi:alpha-glucosidase